MGPGSKPQPREPLNAEIIARASDFLHTANRAGAIGSKAAAPQHCHVRYPVGPFHGRMLGIYQTGMLST